MGSDKKVKQITEEELLEMARNAVMDNPLYCPYCQCRVYESDYDNCGECGRGNPLKAMGW